MIDIQVQFTRGEFSLEASLKDSGFVGLTGANGSGKTTLLHLVAGVEVPDSGRIIVGSRDITFLPINERRVVYLNPETYFGHVDVERHLAWGIRGGKEQHEDSINEMKRALGITYTAKVSVLSLGQRARVILGTAMLAQPDLVLIDELFANLSEAESVVEYVKGYAGGGGSDVIFVSQEQGALRAADTVYRMENGRIV